MSEELYVEKRFLYNFEIDFFIILSPKSDPKDKSGSGFLDEPSVPAGRARLPCPLQQESVL